MLPEDGKRLPFVLSKCTYQIKTKVLNNEWPTQPVGLLLLAKNGKCPLQR